MYQQIHDRILVWSGLEGTFKDHFPWPADHAAFDLLEVKVIAGLADATKSLVSISYWSLGKKERTKSQNQMTKRLLVM